jgi:hypothetical protein
LRTKKLERNKNKKLKRFLLTNNAANREKKTTWNNQREKEDTWGREWVRKRESRNRGECRHRSMRRFSWVMAVVVVVVVWGKVHVLQTVFSLFRKGPEGKEILSALFFFFLDWIIDAGGPWQVAGGNFKHFFKS